MNAEDITNYDEIGIIPLNNIPSQQFQIALNGQNCTIAVFSRGDDVFVDLYCNDVPIALGVIGLDRVGIKTSEYMPFIGQIWFEDLSGTEKPNYEYFGTRFILKYGLLK